MSAEKQFHIFTVGWEIKLIRSLLTPMEPLAGVTFTHGLIWPVDETRLRVEQDFRFVRLGLARGESLPPPDYTLLASLESAGTPTIRTMILGDRVLRHRAEEEALGYVTLLARRMQQALLQTRPDLVLGAFDQVHGMLGLAVARSLGVPWVTMAFSVIPENLVGFCRRLTPNSLIEELARPVSASIRQEATEVLERFRSRKMKVVAFRPATSWSERLLHLGIHGSNLARRLLVPAGYTQFVYPTMRERLADIARRNFNALTTPASRFLRSPDSRPFAFFPLQMKPEMSTETQAPFFQDQISLIRQLSDALPIELDFVVKLHLSDPDNYSRALLSQLLRIPRLRIAHPSAASFSFLERAALVFGITGTPCLEAALLGKPVIVFGDSPYLDFPRSERAERPDQWYRQIRRLLALPVPSDDEIADAYARYIARYMPGRINDWDRPIQPEELERLARCFGALRVHLANPSERADWYNQPSFAHVDERSAGTAPGAELETAAQS